MDPAQGGSETRTTGAPVSSAVAGTGSGRGPRVRRRTALWAVLLVGLAFASVIQNWSDNQSSHYDLIRALDAGRTTIDAGPYRTKDKAYYHGHWYSARAPGLAMYSLPFYELLQAVDAPAVARASQALRGEDEMIYFVGLWGSVLPGLVMLLLVWRVADRFEPGYGGPTAVVLGLGTMVLPFSTLLFSHVLAATLGFAAFAIMMRERAGPPRPMLLAAAGLLMGYAITSEYPLALVAVVLGLYLIARPGALTPGLLASRVGAYVLGGVLGIVPLLLYNHAAFHSWTHLAYSNIPQQQKGFFGISAPSLPVLGTLLFDSRGLLTLSPVLVMGAVGTVLLYRRGSRAEALTIAAVCVLYLGYNSGYYLPFGGGAPGPRFLITMLPFLAFPIAMALRRFPGPTVALAGVSIATTVIATITHPLVGYETETVIWARLLGQGSFQPTIASAFGLGRGWGAIWPFFLAAGAGLVATVWAMPRLRISGGTLVAGVLALLAWALFAALAPTVLGIDHRGLLSIVKAGDNLALHKGFGDYPLRTLAPIAAACGFLALGALALLRGEPDPPRAPHDADRAPAPRAALSA
ncbi:MAG TPA: hypothetical protein VNZ01_08305 [Solirubrobacteraceae bacterium]|jgi:hypothetical protein|nr:hypothetical protein [Solirubrobacteraceae bacterium]